MANSEKQKLSVHYEIYVKRIDINKRYGLQEVGVLNDPFCWDGRGDIVSFDSYEEALAEFESLDFDGIMGDALLNYWRLELIRVSENIDGSFNELIMDTRKYSRKGEIS